MKEKSDPNFGSPIIQINKLLKPHIMSIEEYLSQPINDRLESVNSANVNTCPFWLERLQTAINSFNPFAIYFDKRLVSEYWDLLKFKAQ